METCHAPSKKFGQACLDRIFYSAILKSLYVPGDVWICLKSRQIKIDSCMTSECLKRKMELNVMRRVKNGISILDHTGHRWAPLAQVMATKTPGKVSKLETQKIHLKLLIFSLSGPLILRDTPHPLFGSFWYIAKWCQVSGSAIWNTNCAQQKNN